MDKVTKERIQLLHPKLREEVTKIIEEIDKKLSGRAKVRVTHTLRTFEEQKKLYNQGRTAPGRIITHAMPGYSWHNYGLAVDICLIIDGAVASWDSLKDFDADGIADWIECAEVFKKYGWEWGGDWQGFKDYPHFQKRFGKTIKQMIELSNKKLFIQKTKYLEI